nr:dihydroorotase [Fusibacter paucivorans]
MERIRREANVKTLLKGGWLIDPAQKINQKADVLICDGAVEAIVKEDTSAACDDVIDVTGYIVCPGFIDLHVHLREPGLSHKETIYQGSRACAKGGYTTVACMANTNPVVDNVEVLKKLQTIAWRDGIIDIKPIAATTVGLAGQALTDHNALVKAGAIAFSDDGRTTMRDTWMIEALETSKRFGVPIITHSEDHEITDHYQDEVYPIEAEYKIVKRDLALCEQYGGHLHVAHVSGEQTLAYIREAKEQGIHVTCEVTPHHFGLNDEMVNTLSPMSKVNPPIRSPKAQQAVIKALIDGTVDIIATDHAPHEESSKKGTYRQASYGISGIETAFSVGYTSLVDAGYMDLENLIVKMSTRPAEIAGFKDVGALKPGFAANIAVLDIGSRYEIDRMQFVSKGKNTPFHGMKVKGEVVMTFYQGKRVYMRTEA